MWKVGVYDGAVLSMMSLKWWHVFIFCPLWLSQYNNTTQPWTTARHHGSEFIKNRFYGVTQVHWHLRRTKPEIVHSHFPPPRMRQCSLYIALERVGQQGLSGQQSAVMCYTSLRNHILQTSMIMIKLTKHFTFICTRARFLKAGGFTRFVSLVLKQKWNNYISGPQILAQRTPWWNYYLGQKTLNVPQAKMKTKT